MRLQWGLTAKCVIVVVWRRGGSMRMQTCFGSMLCSTWKVTFWTTILITSVGTVGMFSALPMLVCSSWHHRSKKFNTGRERAQRFVTMWFLHLFSQRNQKCDEDCRLGQTVDLHMRRTKLINKNLDDNVYLVSFGRKFITDLIQLSGSTHPKFDVWHNRWS